MAINIAFASDVKPFLKGSSQVEGGLDDINDSLDDLARESRQAGDKAGNALEGIGKDAKSAGSKIESEIEAATRESGREAERMEKKFSDAFREVQRESKRSFDDVGDNARRASREGGDATSEFKDEARQNFGEIASSFSGDMDSIVDLAQGTLGGLAGTLTGPLGLALGGLAATAGLFYGAWSENSEKTEARISSMYENMKESGQDFLNEEYIRQSISDIIDGVDGAIRSYDQVKKDAEAVGLSTGTVLRAWAGDRGAVTEVVEAARAKQAELLDQFRSGDLAGADYSKASTAVTNLTGALDGAAAQTEVAQQKAQDYRAAIAGLPESKVTNMEVNTVPGRMGMGDFYRDIESARPSVQPRLDTSQADRDLSTWAGQQRSIPVALRIRPGMEHAI